MDANGVMPYFRVVGLCRIYQQLQPGSAAWKYGGAGGPMARKFLARRFLARRFIEELC